MNFTANEEILLFFIQITEIRVLSFSSLISLKSRLSLQIRLNADFGTMAIPMPAFAHNSAVRASSFLHNIFGMNPLKFRSASSETSA